MRGSSGHAWVGKVYCVVTADYSMVNTVCSRKLTVYNQHYVYYVPSVHVRDLYSHIN